jgi:gluconokinase
LEQERARVILVVMGVVGSGKTTIGQLLAQEVGWQFADADDFHPQENLDKISHGIPLTDEDRAPWLARLREQIATWIGKGNNAVLACSALKRSYRRELEVGPEVRFVYLKGTPAVIDARLRARHGHFADDRILASQFADLQEPEHALTVDIDATPQQIVAEIRQKLALA